MVTKIDKKIVGYKVLDKSEPIIIDKTVEEFKPLKRPDTLTGSTTKIRNHAENYNLYMTVNYHNGKPFEIFFDSSHTESAPWVKGLSRMMSAMLRSPDENLNIAFVAKQLMLVHSDQGYHTGGKGGFVPGIVNHIGRVLRDWQEPVDISFNPEEDAITSELVDKEYKPNVEPIKNNEPAGEKCPECKEYAFRLIDGCMTCTTCGHSKCG